MSVRRPNILLLFTDQQRADSIAALGHPVARTPQMDRLVREGTTFTRAFTPSPVCCSARCCLHTGHYTPTTGLYENGPWPDETQFVSYPQFLSDRGYRTHAVGKCHFTPDKQSLRGFQSRDSQEEGQSKIEGDDFMRWLADQGYDYSEPHGARGQMYYTPQISSLPEEAHPTRWVADRSIEFLESMKEGDQPWMLFSSFIHPHPPFAPPKPWHKLYHVSQFEVPEPPGSEDERGPFCWVNRHQNRYKYRDGGFDYQMVRLIRAYYAACVSFIDHQIGRIREVLERNGQLDNTLIVLASDHGELLGDFHCFGKRSMHDAAARIPMICRHPDFFPADVRNETAASLVDLFPTFASVAGASGEAEALGLEGRDLTQFARAEDRERVVFSQLQKGERGLYLAADANGKFIHSAGDGKSWAYETAESDRINRWEGEASPAGLKRLESELLTFLKASGEEAAYEEEGGALTWRPYPPVDESYLADPNAKLLNQDHPAHPRVLEGYSEKAI